MTIFASIDDAVDLAHFFVFEVALIPAPKVVLALSGEPRKPGSLERLAELRSARATVVAADQSDVIRQVANQGRASGERGMFVVALASHGFTDQGSDFLVAADSVRRRIQRTGIAVSELLEDVAGARSKRQLVLLDACRERLWSDTRASAADPESALGHAFADPVAKAEGQVVLAAATIGGYAYDDHEALGGRGRRPGAAKLQSRFKPSPCWHAGSR